MRWEKNFLLWVQKNLRSPAMTSFFQFVSRSVDWGAIWIFISLGMMIAERTRRGGFACMVTLVADFILVNVILKYAVRRLRPFQTMKKLSPLVPPPDDFSFPSGHTAASFAAAAAVRFAGYPNVSIFLFAFAALVGFSRIYLGVHYLTDVVGGGVIGVVVAYGVHLVLGACSI